MGDIASDEEMLNALLQNPISDASVRLQLYAPLYQLCL